MALIRAERLACVALNTHDPAALAAFYRDALGFTIVAADRLRLGDTELALRTVPPTAAAYPADVPGWSPWFQHCAITVTNMGAAFARLSRHDGWRSITRDGPQTLPPSSGSVVAFKFRDPDGHPLELLIVPGAPSTVDAGTSPFVRIDHSAISVADVEHSIAFYEAMGLTVAARSLNRGIEQQRLDDVADPKVDVVTLAFPGESKPHVELLHYRGAFDRPQAALRSDAIAATTLVFDGAVAGRMRDPDGHYLEVSCAVR